MENSYGIGVANRYALFLDDEESDPLEVLFEKEKEKELKKKTKVAEKENKTKPEPAKGKQVTAVPKKTIKDPASNKIQENKRDDNKPTQRSNQEGKPERPFNRVNENREERNNRRNREERPYNGPSENRDRENRPRRETNDGDNRNRDRGDRIERGERSERGDRRPTGNRTNGNGPRGPRKTFDDRRGKREFDRQSGSDKTGVKPVEKRDGAGAHNWGSTKDLIEAVAERPLEADQSWGENDKPEPNNETEKKDESESAEQAPTEGERQEITLEEWKAKRNQRVKPQYNIRKAGEGEDPTQWKKMFELKKKEKEEESEEEEYDAAEYPQRVGRQKHVLDIDIQFNDSRRLGGGRGRGGRGGGRGGRGGGPRGPPRDREGGPREGRENRESGGERRFHDDQTEEKAPRAPKVDDERDFPSLS